MVVEDPASRMAKREPFVRRARIRAFKSIGACDVALRPLTVLCGRNGSGKSNFLDALRFVMDGLQTSLDHAIKSRGGIDEVRRRSTGHPRNFAIQLNVTLSDGRPATYGFEIAARPQGGFVVKQEHAVLPGASYRVEEGEIRLRSLPTMPPSAPDRLYLVNAAGLPEFRELYDSMLRMGFYNLNPEVMKRPQNPDAGELLQRDGGNIASVITRLATADPNVKDRIKSYLATIVPGIVDFDRVSLGAWETLEFRQEVVGARHPWKFQASSMSDGTLRALGALVAVTQLAAGMNPVSLVGIEEPETALHPAAAGALMDAIKEAAAHTQVLITTHSPELVDQIDPESLLGVQSRLGDTEIGPIDPASRDAIKRHLYSPGELLRMNQLSVDPDDVDRQKQMELFTDVSDR
jgi:predicted ATPase